MQRIKNDDGVEAVLKPTFNVKDAAELAEAEKKKRAVKKDQVEMTKPGVNRIITVEGLKAHNEESEPWFVVKGEIYDGTG